MVSIVKFYSSKLLISLSIIAGVLSISNMYFVCFENNYYLVRLIVVFASFIVIIALSLIAYIILVSENKINASLLRTNRQNMHVDSLEKLLDQIGGEDKNKYSAVIARKKAEIIALQSQINPHFLYNTLDAIRGQALLDGSTVVADMAEALAMLFRYSISHLGSLVTLRDEIRNVEKYLMIQQFRFNNKFSVKREYDSDILNRYYIPRLTLQPIVENAIYHGLETKKGGGQICFKIYTTQHKLVIIISDNGSGMANARLETLNNLITQSYETPNGVDSDQTHSGIALPNIHQRIQLLFGLEYGISIFSTVGVGTDVEIVLPQITSNENLFESEDQV